MKIISVTNQKGGVGKTTTCIELAASLSNLDKKVLLLDMDQQCNLTDYVLEENKAKTIYDLLLAFKDDNPDSCNFDDVIQHMPKFDFIASDTALSKAERVFIDDDDKFLVADLLDLMREAYDYVIIDNAPSRNILVQMSYIAADYLIIPTECDDGSLTGVIAVNDDVKKLRASRNHLSHAEILAFVLTKYERTNMHNDAVDILSGFSDSEMCEGTPIVATIRKGIVASQAKAMKKSVAEISPWCTVSSDYRKLAFAIESKVEA